MEMCENQWKIINTNSLQHRAPSTTKHTHTHTWTHTKQTNRGQAVRWKIDKQIYHPHNSYAPMMGKLGGCFNFECGCVCSIQEISFADGKTLCGKFALSLNAFIGSIAYTPIFFSSDQLLITKKYKQSKPFQRIDRRWNESISFVISALLCFSCRFYLHIGFWQSTNTLTFRCHDCHHVYQHANERLCVRSACTALNKK